MNFEDIKDKLTTIKKLHVAKDRGETTIFYRKPYSARLLTVKIATDNNTNASDKVVNFDLEQTEHLSLNSKHGLLVQMNEKLYSFNYDEIDTVEVLQNE